MSLLSERPGNSHVVCTYGFSHSSPLSLPLVCFHSNSSWTEDTRSCIFSEAALHFGKDGRKPLAAELDTQIERKFKEFDELAAAGRKLLNTEHHLAEMVRGSYSLVTPWKYGISEMHLDLKPPFQNFHIYFKSIHRDSIR